MHPSSNPANYTFLVLQILTKVVRATFTDKETRMTKWQSVLNAQKHQVTYYTKHLQNHC
jgi:hypothetical protein